jgi:hypothetical protein
VAVDIFRFWSVGLDEMKTGGQFIHPADRDVLHRVKHPFDLRCLPGCWLGPLRTAPVVLLYLSPGWSKQDLVHASSSAAVEQWPNRINGRTPLESRDRHHTAWKWWSSRTKHFCEDWQQLQSRVAVLNIGAYHSKTLAETSLLAALPSSRATLDWAQGVLFPEAIGGKRIVVCLRASRFWGLSTGTHYGTGLFCPHVTRGGHMVNNSMRTHIIDAVRKKLEL